MNRREVLSVGVGASSLASLGAFLQSAEAVAGPASKGATSPFSKVLETSSKCVSTGLVCVHHCQQELAQGNKIMAECLQSVLELIAACEALTKLAAYESPFTKEFAKLSAKVCANCAKLCEKHSHHMEACKNCLEACRECEKACLAL